MDKRRITICDENFLPFGARAMGLDGERLGEPPASFEWEPAPVNTARFVTDGQIRNARGRGQVAWLLEPPALHPENYQIAWERRHEFDAVLAHSEAWLWGARWYPHGGSRIKPENWGLHWKTKNISMICGPKESMPGHKFRLWLAENMGGEVDIYHDNPDKLETLAPYRYSIVIENERSAGFFTEKLVDCVSVGTIPIYWGAEAGMHHFLSGSVFPEVLPHTIAVFLKGATPELYDRHLYRLKIDLARCAEVACAEDWIYKKYPELFA